MALLNIILPKPIECTIELNGFKYILYKDGTWKKQKK